MQQLSSRDCDKWLSMTLTMKDRFSSAWRGGRETGRQKEMREREREAAGGLLPLCRPGCIGLESDTLKPRARFW